MSRTMFRTLVVATLVLLVIAVMQPAAANNRRTLDDTERIAVVSAFDPELQVLLDNTVAEDNFTINGVVFTTGELAGNDVVLFLSGVSMVNAAMTMQLALDQFTVSHIVYSGIAGGVNPDLSIGDVTVPAQWAQYQEQLFARSDGEGGWQLLPWHNDAYGNFGMMFPQTVNVRSARSPEGEDIFWFPVDAEMLAVATQSAQDVELANCTQNQTCLSEQPIIQLSGNGVSGQTFVDNAEYRQWVWESFQADALDMETAAVAHVAYVNGVPYIAFRSLSDLAGGGEAENEIGIFFQLAADNSAKVVMAFLANWAAR